MKIFGLISFAAILNHLTPVLAASSYICGESFIQGYYIQHAFDEAHGLKLRNDEQNYGTNELFAEILWVKALIKGEEIECKPATKEPKQSSAPSWSS
uniref:Bgt_avrF2_13 n=1 Tax=Blumeria graminis f. sp. tritici 96224 TaxID=1268274 RepID=A0A381LD27_BLUGR